MGVRTENGQFFAHAEVVNLNGPLGGGPQETPIEELFDDLPSLPPNVHHFRDPRHDHLLSVLDRHRILLLSGYKQSAAYAAAFSLAQDAQFTCQARRALFLGARDKDRPDLDLMSLTKEAFLSQKPQILLIAINSKCALLDSTLDVDVLAFARVRDRLLSYRSYVIVLVDEKLLSAKAAPPTPGEPLPCYTVSYLRYLLARDLADRAEEIEKRLLASMQPGASPVELHELQERVANLLAGAEGVSALKKFLLDLEQASHLPPAARKELLQPVQPQDVLRESSEIHRAAAFVATYFPELGQRDFDRLVLLLLGDSTTTVERERKVVGNDGTVVTLQEPAVEPWSERWHRDGDQVFHDCHLRTVIAGDGSWVIDFTEPYLRRELRGHLERHFPWHIRRQCKVLQDSGILFAPDLSPAAVEGLVQLFLERAIVDPAGFGNGWLLDVVLGLRVQLHGEPPSEEPGERLAWLIDKVAEAHLKAHVQGRLASLIREMLDHERLRPFVRSFFEILIAAREHDALLDVVLELARRLRFAPHFDPLVWMKRLLDQGSEPVRLRTAACVTALAMRSGPRLYEVLSTIRGWLPEADRPAGRFSSSNRFALDFPFTLSLEVARSVPPERFGSWPSRHPLFSALPDDPAEARSELGRLVEWVLDPRGAALETADPAEATRTAEAVRMGRVAALLEHWAWALEGGTAEGAAEGRDLFRHVLEEVCRRTAARERSWLQRGWQRGQDECLREAAGDRSSGGAERSFLVARRAKLDDLRTRFAELAARQEPPGR